MEGLLIVSNVNPFKSIAEIGCAVVLVESAVNLILFAGKKYRQYGK